MDLLGTFLLNNPFRLLQLAKQLQERRFFQSFLNDFQSRVITFILQLDNADLWSHFLEGNCVLMVTSSGSSGDSNGSESVEGVEEGASSMSALALHVRYLLWEKAIDFFYSTNPAGEDSPQGPRLEEVSEAYELIENLNSFPEDANSGVESADQNRNLAPTKKVRDEDDDYDDDDDDGENKDAGNQAKSPSDAAEHSSVNFNQNGKAILEIPASFFKEKLTDNDQPQHQSTETTTYLPNPITTNDDQDVLVKEFNKVYHNFEYDRETLIKRRKLEKSDLQLANSKSTEADTTNAVPINLGMASHSLRHLLNILQDRREEVGLNDHDLKTLFMDVRKNRGKWANDERIGQEELYDACEKVLLDLRGYTEHSTPFLNKVSKREAPNYGLIIKKPMDLNTVMKKLKSLSYNSKQEFADDLMLIWNNCLTYNADPKHYLRAHAIAMQKRTQKLIPTIPDITIKNRSEMEKEEDLEPENKASTPALKGGKKSSKIGRKRTRGDVIKSEENDAIATDSANLAEATSAQETPAPASADVTKAENGGTSAGGDETGPKEEEEEEEAEEAEADIVENENEDETDLELQAWKTLTSKSRANYCASRAALFGDDNKLKMDAEAIVREPVKMKNFNQFLDNKEVVSKSNKLLDTDEPYLLEYDVAGGVPGLKYGGCDDTTQEKEESDMVEALLKSGEATEMKSVFALAQDRGLNGLYTENITEIQEIRKICFKISLIRQMQMQQYMHRTQMRQPEIDYLKEVDVDPVSKLPNHDRFDEGVQHAALKKSVAKIAMHTGFETTQPLAINTLTQVAERYLLNLAKSIKLHCESTSKNQLSTKNVLLLSLLENGIEKPDELHVFVQERVQKQKAKLKDLRTKLSGFVKDLLRPSLQSFSEKSFEDNSEQFTTGDFTNELGDDFFGFKELGLDKEFNMLTSSIPIYLLHSRLHNAFTNSDPGSKSTKYEDLSEWKVPKLTQADVQQQIGILQPFYNSLVEKTESFFVKLQKRKGESTGLPPPDEFFLIEDEELPQKQRNIRPRLPPTGKIASVKKKSLSQAFILSDESEQETQGHDEQDDHDGEDYKDAEQDLPDIKPDLISLEA